MLKLPLLHLHRPSLFPNRMNANGSEGCQSDLSNTEALHQELYTYQMNHESFLPWVKWCGGLVVEIKWMPTFFCLFSCD